MSGKEETEIGAKKVGPLKGLPTHALKKDIKAGKVITGDDAKTSTQTPDPNVTSVASTGDTVTSGTVTGDANVTRSTTTRSNSGATTKSVSTSTTDGT